MPDTDLSTEDSPIDIPELRTTVLFHSRPAAVAADLRPTWRIGAIVLLLSKCCRNQRTSLTRLHVLSWALLSDSGRQQLSAASQGMLAPDSLVVRFEPFLNQAVDYAVGEQLIRRNGGDRIELTERGAALANDIQQVADIFVAEKHFMDSIRTKITEDMVKKMFGWKAEA